VPESQSEELRWPELLQLFIGWTLSYQISKNID